MVARPTKRCQNRTFDSLMFVNRKLKEQEPACSAAGGWRAAPIPQARLLSLGRMCVLLVPPAMLGVMAVE